jgi:hypothetical protein
MFELFKGRARIRVRPILRIRRGGSGDDSIRQDRDRQTDFAEQRKQPLPVERRPEEKVFPEERIQEHARTSHQV